MQKPFEMQQTSGGTPRHAHSSDRWVGQISGKDPVDPVADITGMIQILDIFSDRGSILCLLGKQPFLTGCQKKQILQIAVGALLCV